MKNSMTETKPQLLGAVYLAFGKPYLAMALVSIESLKQTNPELPVSVLTNVCDSPSAIARLRSSSGMNSATPGAI